MTIKSKLLMVSLGIALFLMGNLALTLYSFNSLNHGFEQIVLIADSGVEQSVSAEKTFSRSDEDMKRVTQNMSALSEELGMTDMQVRLVERKMKGSSATLTELTETVEEIYPELPAGDAKDALEDIADSVSDIQEGMKRETLVGIASTSKRMKSFAETISGEVTRIEKLSEELNRGSVLSRKIAENSSNIKSLSIQFRKEIQRNRNYYCFN